MSGDGKMQKSKKGYFIPQDNVVLSMTQLEQRIRCAK